MIECVWLEVLLLEFGPGISLSSDKGLAGEVGAGDDKALDCSGLLVGFVGSWYVASIFWICFHISGGTVTPLVAGVELIGVFDISDMFDV